MLSQSTHTHTPKGTSTPKISDLPLTSGLATKAVISFTIKFCEAVPLYAGIKRVGIPCDMSCHNDSVTAWLCLVKLSCACMSFTKRVIMLRGQYNALVGNGRLFEAPLV